MATNGKLDNQEQQILDSFRAHLATVQTVHQEGMELAAAMEKHFMENGAGVMIGDLEAVLAKYRGETPAQQEEPVPQETAQEAPVDQPQPEQGTVTGNSNANLPKDEAGQYVLSGDVEMAQRISNQVNFEETNQPIPNRDRMARYAKHLAELQDPLS